MTGASEMASAGEHMRMLRSLIGPLCLCATVAGRAIGAEADGSAVCPAETAKQVAAGAQASFSAEVGDKLRDLCAKHEFSGVVLVARGGRQMFAGAYGFSDRAREIHNSLDTKFRIASDNKMFTAVGVLQLAERGKIQLDNTVGRYLPEYPNKDFASRVTVRQLLNHTAGAGGIWGPEFETHRLELRTLEDYERLNGSRNPEFPPGSKFAYSNYGYILLGLIIEKVSGQNYYDYVRQHVFRIAGMKSTDSEPEDVPVPRRAIGYSKHVGNSGEWQSAADTFPYRGTSAGGGYSTAHDLLQFATALFGNRLLSKRWTDVLTTGSVDMDWPGFKYACGFMDTVQEGVRWVGHSGGAPGVNAEFWVSPMRDDVILNCFHAASAGSCPSVAGVQSAPTADSRPGKSTGPRRSPGW